MPRFTRCQSGQTGSSIVPFVSVKWALLLAIDGLFVVCPAPSHAIENAVIELSYDSVMDMVRPEIQMGIRVHHNLSVTISGYANVAEDRNRGTKRYYDQNSLVQVLGSSDSASAYASWRVAPDGRLVRRQSDPQSTRTMTVILMPGNTCHLDVVDQLKPGFHEYAFLRISTHTIGYFSTYRVISTSCVIH
jgi:hypothetical protein